MTSDALPGQVSGKPLIGGAALEKESERMAGSRVCRYR